MADQPAISYEYPIFESYIEPNGALNIQPACHACFYYGMLAAKAIATQGSSIESQTILYKVGETPAPWYDADLAAIAKSVALIYALENPDVFLVYRKEAWAQAKLLGIELPEIIFNVRPGIVVQ